jgi:hypothetical protein
MITPATPTRCGVRKYRIGLIDEIGPSEMDGVNKKCGRNNRIESEGKAHEGEKVNQQAGGYENLKSMFRSTTS